MKPSLEEERRALLEKIEASRAVYRRMLATDEKGSPESVMLKHPLTSLNAQPFPRSRTVHWVMNHPWWIAVGVATIVWVGPDRLTSLFGRTHAGQPHSNKAVKSMRSIGAMLLRDHSKLRAAGRLVVMGFGLLQRGRARKNALRCKSL